MSTRSDYSSALSPDFSREVLTALSLSVGSAVALGFSRFAYALLLPPMRADLRWSYVEAGALNTANALGYIVGAILTPWFAKKWGASRCFIAALSTTVVLLLLTAQTSNLASLFLVRTIGGVSTALTFILGTSLAAAIGPPDNPRRRGLVVGIYVAGSSLGIVLAGIAIPLLLQGGVQRWRAGWIVLAIIGLIGLFPASYAARSVFVPGGSSMAMLKSDQLRHLAPTFVAYGLFGAGYVGYMTFIIALLRSQGSGNTETALFWILLGLVSTVTTLVWGQVLGHFEGGRGPALVFAIVMLGTLPVLLAPGPAAMFVSAVLFGGSFLAAPTAITILAQRHLPVRSWTVGFSLLTVAFALGQAVGPIVAGAISDTAGSITKGFWVSPVSLALASCLSLLQRRNPISSFENPTTTLTQALHIGREHINRSTCADTARRAQE